MEMFWVVFVAFNPSKLPDVRELQFHVDVVSGHPHLPDNTVSDTGAAVYKYLWKHPDLQLQAFPWQSSYTYRCLGKTELKKMGISDLLIRFIDDIAPENVQFFAFEHFVHFSAGSWEGVSQQFQAKLVRFSTFIDDVVRKSEKESSELRKKYELSRDTPSDINEHINTLCCLAKECSSVVELGVRSMVSSWGILQGLSERTSAPRSYLGVDLALPPVEKIRAAKRLAQGNGITFNLCQANDMDIDIEPTEMLFIDSLHTYCHLTYELEKFSPKISKYIAMHDTSWGNIDDPAYQGDFSEYPLEYDRIKRGLWLAIEDFLKRHPEWVLYARYLNNYGLTILKRRGNGE